MDEISNNQYDRHGTTENAPPETVNDDQIHDKSYGLNKLGRMVITYVVTFILCVVVIASSYIIAIVLPSDKDATEEYANELRGAEVYTSAKDEFSRLTAEVKELSATVSEKEEKVKDLSDPENTKAELRDEINKKSEYLKKLNDSINTKTNKLSEINAGIMAASGVTLSLSPGRYTVGRDIAPGIYHITGYGSFAAASSSGQSKYNLTLGSTPYEIELSSGDKLKLECTVKFTPPA